MTQRRWSQKRTARNSVCCSGKNHLRGEFSSARSRPDETEEKRPLLGPKCLLIPCVRTGKSESVYKLGEFFRLLGQKTCQQMRQKELFQPLKG